jgi:penicillin-binding protein 1A
MLLLALLVSVCGAGLGVLAAIGWVVAVADSAPNIDQLTPRNPGQLSEVYAANGELLGYISSDILRTVVPRKSQPKLLRQATVAIEDRRFWQHGGVDYQGIIRAGLRDLFDGGNSVQGGSTLTMQLVNNVYLPETINDHHDIRYKIIQAKLANELEARESKASILTQYLNDVDYGTIGGQTAIGVGAASQLYFDKPVDRLDLAQIALLAGLPQAPSQYNPFNAPGLAEQRRSEVLAAMVQSHYISQDQANTADFAPLGLHANNTYQRVTEPYVFQYVKQQLIKQFGAKMVERGGMKVYTTIDLPDQALARQAILSHEGGPGQPAAALVSINPSNGNILAMAQSSTYSETNFDYATQSQRQTGSSFKPFVLMTLIHDANGDPNETYVDSHFLAPGWLPSYPTYSVHTAEMSYQGVINVTKAMTDSDNTVFAQLGVDLGMTKVDAMAHAMGITSPLFGYPAEAIGGLKIGVSPLQMSDAYATISNGGMHYAPTAIARVVLANGKSVDLGNPVGKSVFTPGEAYVADQVLKTVITAGTGTAADYGCPAAGKTGTTSNFTDAWFVGYTPELSTAVWVGYPNATTSMANGFGGTLAAPIWHDYMKAASAGYCGDFPVPAVQWHGKPYYGKYTATQRSYSYGLSYNSGNSGSGVVPPTTTPAYTNTTVYPTQPGTTPATGTSGTAGRTGAGTGATPGTGTNTGAGNGNGNGQGGPPAGFGDGRAPTGGAGVHKPGH